MKLLQSFLELHHSEAALGTRRTGGEVVGIEHGGAFIFGITEGPSELVEREGLTIEVSTGAEEDGSVEVYRRVMLASKRVIGSDIARHLYDEVVEMLLIGEDDGMGTIARHGINLFGEYQR